MATRTPAPTKSRKAAAPTAPRLCLWVKNEAGRRGVPLLRSFQKWLDAIPELRARRDWTEVNILIVDAKTGRRYNREFRGRDYATNVLSFPYEQGERLAGDLVVCQPVLLSEAQAQGKSFARHAAHLIVHGTLHLQGWDHETSDADAEAMEAEECVVLAALGLPDPYADDAPGSAAGG